jgi:hypothetical protein
LSQLRQQESLLRRYNVQIAVVTFQSPSFAQEYVRATRLSWPVLIDESLTLYRAYGMRRGKLWPIWGPPAWLAYIKLLARGRRLRWISGNVFQLGGDVLIGPDGIVRLHHVGAGPADRPAIAELLSVVREFHSDPA